jgi:hypothetical protein
MEKTNDFSPFQWIIDETDRVDFEDWNGSRVKNFIPKRFSYYGKLMHPLYPDRNIKDENLLWSDCDPDEKGMINYGERIFMKDLAEKYGLKFTKEFSFETIGHLLGGFPRYLLGPEEGSMDPKMTHEVIKVLTPFTDGSCFFQYDLIKVKDYLEDHGYGYLFYGSLKDVERLGHSEELHGFPTYWWPEDKSWCLYTDLDLDFTLFGGNKEMMQALKINPEIEFMEVDKSTRVDHDADVTNLSSDHKPSK